MLTASFARVLGPGHAAAVSAVLAADPVSSCLVASRFEQVGMNEAALGGQFWGVGGGRDGLCFAGSTMVPLSGDAAAVRSFAHVATRRARSCATILGPAGLVLPLWDRLEPRWGAARDVRVDQPLMVCAREPSCVVDERVAPAQPADLDAYFPAAVSMFTEEVGVDPRANDGGTGYRKRIEDLIAQGRAFVRFEDGEVVFKAEVGAMSRRVALIQGIWVHPELRGRGLGAPATAAVVRAVQHQLRRVPSLYVNAHNTPARAAYRRVGFEQVGTFASVLF